MAKVKMNFKRQKVKVSAHTSPKYRNLYMMIALVGTLLVANFAWDGYQRKDDLSKYYGLTKQYYGIILDEADSFANTLKKRINITDKIEKGK